MHSFQFPTNFTLSDYHDPITFFTTQRPIVDRLITMVYAASPTSSEIFKDDPLWKEYVKQAAEFDGRMVDEWWTGGRWSGFSISPSAAAYI